MEYNDKKFFLKRHYPDLVFNWCWNGIVSPEDTWYFEHIKHGFLPRDVEIWDWLDVMKREYLACLYDYLKEQGTCDKEVLNALISQITFEIYYERRKTCDKVVLDTLISQIMSEAYYDRKKTKLE